MKIKKLYENNKDLAKEFKKLVIQKFFIGLDEFDDIVIKYDVSVDVFKFKICFSSIFKETVESIEKFEIFMGYSGWMFETEIVDDSSYSRIYYLFHLDDYTINMYMEKFQLEKDANKYNL